MANAREILSRMKSVQDTRKITNAMYLISSTKLKKSKKLLEETEPYFYTLQDLIRRILRHMPDVEHFYFNPRKEIKEEDRIKGLIDEIGPFKVEYEDGDRMRAEFFKDLSAAKARAAAAGMSWQRRLSGWLASG